MSEYKDYEFEIIQTIKVTAKEQEEVHRLAETVGLDYLNKHGYPAANTIEEFVKLYGKEYFLTLDERHAAEAPFLDIGGYAGYMHTLAEECIEDEEYRVGK